MRLICTTVLCGSNTPVKMVVGVDPFYRDSREALVCETRATTKIVSDVRRESHLCFTQRIAIRSNCKPAQMAPERLMRRVTLNKPNSPFKLVLQGTKTLRWLL